MGKVLFLLFTMTTFNSFAACSDDKLSISIRISKLTSDIAYRDGISAFLKDDVVRVTELETNETTEYRFATIQSDRSNNHAITFFDLSKQVGPEYTGYIYYEDKVWETKGLYGHITVGDNEYELSNMKPCSYDDLITHY